MVDIKKQIEATKKLAKTETEPKKKKILKDYAALLTRAEKLSMRLPDGEPQTQGIAVGVS